MTIFIRTYKHFMFEFFYFQKAFLLIFDANIFDQYKANYFGLGEIFLKG